MNQLTQQSVLHVRYQGRSLEIPLADLDVGTGTPDANIRESVASYLAVPKQALRQYVIDRHETGNLTLRPQAVFG